MKTQILLVLILIGHQVGKRLIDYGVGFLANGCCELIIGPYPAPYAFYQIPCSIAWIIARLIEGGLL